MRDFLYRLTAGVALTLCICVSASAQVPSTGSITGTITDEKDAVIQAADVLAISDSTKTKTKGRTADNGTYFLPALAPDDYTVVVSKAGFAEETRFHVKVNTGKPSSVNITLRVVPIKQDVRTTATIGELMQPTAVVALTVGEAQLAQLPFTSRDAQDWMLVVPGINTTGRPRTSTLIGLPKGAFGVFIDGLNVQDNVLRSSDGFLPFIRPRTDAIAEATALTAAPHADSNGDGAAQIRFVTRRGTNEYHGGLYYFHRNPALSANNYFNNLSGLPRDRVLLNQYGFRLGGPLRIPGRFDGRDKVFFFVNYEEFRLPEQTTRDRMILNQAAETGTFTTAGGAAINLLSEAAATNCNPAGVTEAMMPCASTIDPTVQNVLSAVRSATGRGSTSALDSYRQNLRFINTGGQNRRFATVRIDINLSPRHTLENVWNYQSFRNRGDFVNFSDASFPGIEAGVKGQNSNRFSNSLAVRSVIRANLINEARIGVVGGTSSFYPRTGISSFDISRGFSFGSISPSTGACTGGFVGAGISCPTASITTKKGNAPLVQFTDNVTWIKGQHTFSFGGAYSRYRLFADTVSNLVPSITFGLDSTDPASRIFTGSAFTGLSSADLTAAQNVYAILTGRVTSISGAAYVDENTGQLRSLGSIIERANQRQFGFYAQDSWRVLPNLTLEGGLRWEVQLPYEVENSTYTKTTYPELFGISGENNLFTPGVMTGKVTEFNPVTPGEKVYNTDWNNFAPSFGFSYSPNWRNSFLRKLTGEAGQTIVRAGYSIAFVREGLQSLSSMFGPVTGANPGGKVDISRSIAAGNLTAGTLLSTINQSNALLTPPAAPTFPFIGVTADGVNVFEPNLQTGYVQSISFGVQREIARNNVIEFRYVGSRGVKLWEQIDINEVNLVESGFLDEFKNAQANLLANIQNGVGNTYRYNGPDTGTVPLPTMLAYFSGVAPSQAGNCFTGTGTGSCTSLYNSTLFANTTLIGNLLPNNAAPQGFVSEAPTGFAKSMIGSSARRANAIAAGLPANLFVANPNYIVGGAFAMTNRGRSYYDGVTVELRRRMADGLLLGVSHTFSKASSNMFANHQAVFYVPGTLRNDRLDRGPSPFDIRHAFKANWVYDLPLRGLLPSSAPGALRELMSRWSFNGTMRWQSGSPFNMGNVQLIGMNRQELQNSVSIRKDPAGSVYYLPDDIILNTRRAFNTITPNPAGTAEAVAGYSTLGIPSGRYIAPANSNGCMQAFVGQCGFRNLILYGPSFFRADLSITKRTYLTETTNLEYRAEFLNAFNNSNIRVGDPGSEVNSVANFNSSAFGTTTNSYRDVSTTNDPGGRMIQFVLRVNF